MNVTMQRTVDVLGRLGDAAQETVLKFAESLASESDADVISYDTAKADDDGYRVSGKDLRAKYGL